MTLLYLVAVELCLHECYQEMPLEAISEEDCLILTLTLICFDWLNDITDLRRNAFATSAGLNKPVSSFHLFRCIFAIKSANNACWARHSYAFSGLA